jgi:hypothetical protein
MTLRARQSYSERPVRLIDGPFAGTEVEKRGASLIVEGPGVPDGQVARYRWSAGADGYVFKGSEAVILRVPR